MTDQERVEKVAEAIAKDEYPESRWPDNAQDTIEDWCGVFPVSWDYAQKCRKQARAVIAALTPTPQEADPRCAKCGHPKSNHPYRHPFVSIAQDAAMDRLVAEGQQCDAATPQEGRNLPDRIMVWHSSPTLDHLGTWATTRYPVEAKAYVRADDNTSQPTPQEAAKVREKLERIVSASDYYGKEATDHDALTLAYAHQSTRNLAISALDALRAISEDSQ